MLLNKFSTVTSKAPLQLSQLHSKSFCQRAVRIVWLIFCQATRTVSSLLYDQREEPPQTPEDSPQTSSHTLRTITPKKVVEPSHADRKAIKELKTKNYICLPSDKGTKFCVIQQDTYTQVALTHLSDSNTYQKVPRMLAKTVQDKVNSTLKNICLQNEFHPYVRKSFITANTDLPSFCHLIKTTKLVQILKYDPLYLPSVDQPSACHGRSPKPLNQC